MKCCPHLNQTHINMRKKPWNKKLIIIFVVVFLIGLSVTYLYTRQKNRNTTHDNNNKDSTITEIDTKDWLTFDPQAPFSFQYPTSWGLEAVPSDEQKQGIHLQGPEGDIYLNWGKGFTGECEKSSLTQIEFKQEKLPACSEKVADGVEQWRMINKQLSPEVSFSARATANNPSDKNRAMILKIFSTVTFK